MSYAVNDCAAQNCIRALESYCRTSNEDVLHDSESSRRHCMTKSPSCHGGGAAEQSSETTTFPDTWEQSISACCRNISVHCGVIMARQTHKPTTLYSFVPSKTLPNTRMPVPSAAIVIIVLQAAPSLQPRDSSEIASQRKSFDVELFFGSNQNERLVLVYEERVSVAYTLFVALEGSVSSSSFSLSNLACFRAPPTR